MKLVAATIALGGVLAQRRRPRPQGPATEQGLNLARFRGNPAALRMMPSDMVTTAFCLLNKAQAETQLDKAYYDMFCEKAEREGMPDYVYDSMIHGLVAGDPMAPPDPGMMRNVLCPDGNSCIVPLTLKGIWGYGCWCNFGISVLQGESQPVNAYDSICKSMQQCLRCVKFDGEEAGETCDPKNPPEYNSTFTLDTARTGLAAQCGTQNNNDCAIRICTCELSLLSGVLEALWDGENYNSSYLHIYGFDPSEECGAVNQPTSGEELAEPGCCGVYPERETYNKVSRSCCESTSLPADQLTQTLYNQNTHQCCADGSVIAPGDQCP